MSLNHCSPTQHSSSEISVLTFFLSSAQNISDSKEDPSTSTKPCDDLPVRIRFHMSDRWTSCCAIAPSSVYKEPVFAREMVQKKLFIKY